MREDDKNVSMCEGLYFLGYFDVAGEDGEAARMC